MFFVKFCKINSFIVNIMHNIMHVFNINKKGINMGFEINNNFVCVNHSHNAYAHTTVCDENPYIRHTPNKLITIGLFKRTKGKRSKKGEKPIGDNCPMIYALKAKNGLQTDRWNAFLLYRSAIRIFNTYVSANGKSWDLIIPIPSSSTISLRLAHWIAKNCQIEIAETYLSKSLIRDIDSQLEILKRSKKIHAHDRTQINAKIKNNGLQLEDEFPMKIIPANLRHLLNPFSLTSMAVVSQDPKKILLVDDLVATGTSIDCASSLLRNIFPNAQFECLSLFSMLDK